MRKIIVFMLVLILPLAAGCTQVDNNENQDIPDADNFSIVCTVFPQYDWVRQILGVNADNFDITLLLDNRIDLHNYQPSVDDIVNISNCDLFIYVGGESDEWAEGILSGASNADMRVINLLEALGEAAKMEVIIEGMEEFEESHGHDEEEDSDEDAGEPEYDEHVWLSLRNAQFFCSLIADELSLLDAGAAGEYRANYASYAEELSALDAEYQAAAGEASVRTLLFGDRFPFRYLADDYDIDYYAAFPGCSAETEASFETIIFLARKVDEMNLKNVIVTESSDRAIATTIISNTEGKNQQIIMMDALQSVTAGDIQSGTTYLSVMESNLKALKEALQ